jgi:RibD C-terminal domain
VPWWDRVAATPGLIDEYLLVVHPAVIGAGPQLFEQIPTALALRLVEAKVFDAGAVVLRYAVLLPWPAGGASEVEQQPQAIPHGAQHDRRHAAERLGSEPVDSQ